VMMMWRCWWLGTNGDLIEIDDVDISRIIARSLQQHNPQPTTILIIELVLVVE